MVTRGPLECEEGDIVGGGGGVLGCPTRRRRGRGVRGALWTVLVVGPGSAGVVGERAKQPVRDLLGQALGEQGDATCSGAISVKEPRLDGLIDERGLVLSVSDCGAVRT